MLPKAYQDRVDAAFVERLNISLQAIAPDKALKELCGGNEAFVFARLEREFSILIPDWVLAKLVTVQDLYNYIEDRCTPAGALDADRQAAVRVKIATYLRIDLEKVSGEKELIEDLGARNKDVVAIGQELGEQFGIEIPYYVAEGFVTVRDIYVYIGRNRKY